MMQILNLNEHLQNLNDKLVQFAVKTKEEINLNLSKIDDLLLKFNKIDHSQNVNNNDIPNIHDVHIIHKETMSLPNLNLNKDYHSEQYPNDSNDLYYKNPNNMLNDNDDNDDDDDIKNKLHDIKELEKDESK